MQTPPHQPTQANNAADISSLTDDELKSLWRTTAAGKRAYRARQAFWLVMFAILIYLAVEVWWGIGERAWEKPLWEILGFVVWFCGAAFTYGAFDAFYYKPLFNEFKIQSQRRELFTAYESQAHDSLALKDLWMLNQRRLDLYHEIATNQAKVSFRNAQICAAAGFSLLSAAAASAWFARSAAISITIGSIGAFGGMLSAYLGSTFMKSQEGAASQLRQYFDHPLELSKILLVERLVSDLPASNKAETIQIVAQSIISPPQPPTVDTQSTGPSTSQ